jgi:hypothetical protein
VIPLMLTQDGRATVVTEEWFLKESDEVMK